MQSKMTKAFSHNSVRGNYWSNTCLFSSSKTKKNKTFPFPHSHLEGFFFLVWWNLNMASSMYRHSFSLNEPLKSLSMWTFALMLDLCSLVLLIKMCKGDFDIETVTGLQPWLTFWGLKKKYLARCQGTTDLVFGALASYLCASRFLFHWG